MIHILHKKILLNLDKVNNLQYTKISINELELVLDEINTVYKKTAGYIVEKKRKINEKIKKLEDTNGNPDIIQDYKDEIESLKSTKSTLHKKDTLELFVNLNKFLSTISGDSPILQEINISTIENLIDSFNISSVFDKKIGKEGNPTHYTTNGTSGEPDSAILKFVNGKWEIDFTAASNAVNTEYEFLQLFLHPFSLQKALDEVLEEYKDKKDELTKLSYKEMSELVLAEYKPFTLKNEESINKFFEFILNIDIKKLFTNVNIIGAYSNKALSFLNEKNNKRLIKKFIEDGILTEDNKYEEIEEIGNWIMMNGQLASIFKLIGDKTKLNNDEIEDLSGYTLLDKNKALKERNNKLEEKKKNLEDKFVDIIKHMTGKMSYISTISGAEEKEFDEKFDNDEWVNKFFEAVIKHSTENKPVINHKKVKGNITALTSFIARAYEVSSFKIPELELVLGERNLEVIVKSQAATIKHEGIISDAKTEIIEEYKEKLFNFEEVKGIPNKLSPEYEELSMDIKILLDNNPDNFTNKFFTIMNNKAYNIDYINFLNIMKKVGELPNTIDPTIKQDIENIINIFENLESILGITIKNSQMKILFNDILKNSFEDKIISYDTFIDNLSTKLLEIYDESSSTVFNDSIRALTNNVNLQTKDGNKLLSVEIRKKAKEKMKKKINEADGPTGETVEKPKPPKR